MSEFIPGTTTFVGVERDAKGKSHNISRTTCNACGEILSQMHYNCCGFSSCGFGTSRHDCKGKPRAKRKSR